MIAPPLQRDLTFWIVGHLTEVVKTLAYFLAPAAGLMPEQWDLMGRKNTFVVYTAVARVASRQRGE
jgi:hypothetical protein